MKLFCLLFLSLALGGGTLFAQTNSVTNGVDSILALVTTNGAIAPTTNHPAASRRPHEQTVIKAAGPTVIDTQNRWITYSGNVRVTEGEMKLSCDWLKANFPANGDQPTNIVAETNVVVDYVDAKGQKGRALGTNAIYIFQVLNGTTNETVTLKGNPPELLGGPDYKNRMTGSEIVYDVMTGRMTILNSTSVFWPTTNSTTASNGPSFNKLKFGP